MSDSSENDSNEEVEGEEEKRTIESLSDDEVCEKYRSFWKEAKPYTPRNCLHVLKNEEVVLDTDIREVQVCLKCDSSCDLDISCLAYDTTGKFHEAVYFKNIQSKDEKSMLHLGEEEHEKIYMNLNTLKNSYSCLIFTVNIYSTTFFFDRVKDLKIRLDVLEKKSVVQKYSKLKAVKFRKLPSKKQRKKVTGMAMAALYRANDDPLGKWTFRSIGKPIDGRHVLDLDQFKKAKKYIPLPSLSKECPFYDVVADREKKRPKKLRDDLMDSKEVLQLSLNGINLPKKDVIGVCDAYYEIFETANPKKKVAKSAIVKNEKSPVWERMDMAYDEKLIQKELTIRVWDWDRATKDDYIGMAKFHLKDALEVIGGGGITLPLVNEEKGEGKAAGSIGIVCQKEVISGIFKPEKFQKLDYYFDDDWKKKAITFMKGK